VDGFPLYWTKEPRFQGVQCLEDLPPSDQEVCKFLSSLKVVFDTTFLLSNEFTPGALSKEKERLMAHDKNHLVREAIRQFSQALATSCLAATKMLKLHRRGLEGPGDL